MLTKNEMIDDENASILNVSLANCQASEKYPTLNECRELPQDPADVGLWLSHAISLRLRQGFQFFYHRNQPVAARGNSKPPRHWAGNFDRNFHVFFRQAAWEAVGPFNQHQAFAGEVFIDAQGEELVFIAQSIGIDVIDRASAVVF